MSALVEKRLAIVGSEEIAAGYIEALDEFPDVVLDAIVDRESTRGAATIDGRPRRFFDVEDLLRSGVVPHVALICTPHGERAQYAQPLLRAGVDLLIESPLAGTRRDAETITQLAERLGRIAMTSARFRFFSAVREARMLIQKGEIGRLQTLDICLSNKVNTQLSWRRDSKGLGGTWLEDGPDALDLSEALAGPIHRIRMWGTEHKQGSTLEDEAQVEIGHGDDVLSRVQMTWNEVTTAPLVRCTGELGEIIIGWAQSVLRRPDHEQVIADAFDRTEICRATFSAFLRERHCSNPAEDHGGQALAWIEAAYQSLRSQRWELA